MPRTFAFAFTFTFAFAFAFALGGCSAGTRSPAGAVRALAEAAQAGDRAEAWRLSGPATRARLEVAARQASALAGLRPLAPEQMLAAGWFAPRFILDDAREIFREGDTATVEVRGRGDERETVHCVRVDGEWKVELP